ncbi:hypothetical protein CWB90_23725, partial [Pseudoalteromonas piscicida]
MENMFKKTLLALAAAGVTATAQAGTLTVDITETTDIVANFTATDDCAAAAAEAGVALNNPDGKALTSGGDTVTLVDGGAANTYD